MCVAVASVRSEGCLDRVSIETRLVPQLPWKLARPPRTCGGNLPPPLPSARQPPAASVEAASGSQRRRNRRSRADVDLRSPRLRSDAAASRVGRNGYVLFNLYLIDSASRRNVPHPRHRLLLAIDGRSRRPIARVTLHGQRAPQPTGRPAGRSGGASALRLVDGPLDFSSKDVQQSRRQFVIGAMLLELPLPVLALVLHHLDHSTVHAFETAGLSTRRRTAATDYWRQCVLKSIAMHEDDASAFVTRSEDEAQTWRRWKRLACLSTMPCQRDHNLLDSVHGCSSYDRPCESPANTLQPSRCWLSIQKLIDRSTSFDALGDPANAAAALLCLAESAQIECSCNSSSCCFWSSMPSTTKLTDDFIEYATAADCLISRVQIVPYRAFRLPDSPAFAPQFVSFHFFRQDQHELTPIFASPVYAIENDMRLYEFELPHKVLLGSNGLLRVNLHGRCQMETSHFPPWLHDDGGHTVNEPQYYVCLSYVKAVGVAVV